MANRETDNRFNKFGTVSFTSRSKVNDFIDALEAGKVMGTYCAGCNIHYFPPRSDCCKCQEDGLEWFDASEKTGRLETFSKMKFGPVGFEADLPYTIAVVDFDGYKIFGRMADDVPDEALKIGMACKVLNNRLKNDQINFVFRQA